jgi:hypothetical protein
MVASCTAAPAPSRSAGPPPPAGSILAFTQNTQGPPLVAFDVRGTTVHAVGDVARDPAAAAAAPFEGGLLAVVVATTGRATVVRVGGATAPDEIGPVLDGSRDVPYRSLSIARDRVVVADCDRVAVLDTAAARSWHHVGSGCWAALAPDATGIVYSPDGRTVVRTASAGSPRDRVLFDLADVVDLGTARPPRLFGAPAWGGAGIAFTAVAGDQAGVFLLRPDGDVVTLLREKLLKTARPPILSWGPDGRLLAMMDDLGNGGVLRTFDPSTGERRVVALDGLGFDGLVWSPDGSSLATLTSAGALLVVGTDGVWRARVQTTWNGMLGWVE